jgi:GTP-binding protein Era
MSNKSGFVTIIGRPNVGKSTLLNQILGQKIAITSDKPQTTRKRIRGIYTTQEGQIIFIDTPGVHKPLYKLGEFLLDEAKIAVPDADLVLFLVDGQDPPGRGDEWIVKNLLDIKVPIIMVINKVDRVKDIQKRDENVMAYKMLFKENIPVVKISAKTGRNVDTLIKNIYRKLPKGVNLFPDDDTTDQTVREISEEIIREKILINTHDEVPHSIAVVIDKFEEKKTLNKIMATIYVEQDSQKGIIIGKQGQMLKKIGQSAREEIEKLDDKKVFLDLQVKIQKDWRKKDKSLKSFGFVQDEE